MKTERWKAYKIIELCSQYEDKHEYARCILELLSNEKNIEELILELLSIV